LYLKRTIYWFTPLLYGVTLKDKLVKFQKRAAREILDCDLYTPSSELFKTTQLANIPSYLSKSNVKV